MEQWLSTAGVRVVRTPPSAPNCNAHAERFVRSVKEECLQRVVPLGEWHLRRTLREFVAHYHRERNHQGLANELIESPPQNDGPVLCVAASESAKFELLLQVSRVERRVRSLVGQNGDEVRILALRHQREIGFLP